MSCKTKISNKRYCIGDLKHLVSFYDKVINSRRDNDIDPNMKFLNETKVWVAVQSLNTISGYNIIEGSNINSNSINFKFIARYSTDLLTKNFISYKEEYYKIINLTDVGLNNEWIEFFIEKKGTINNKTNQK